MIAECVEFEVKRSLEWLQERERYEPRRHAAVLVLKELAQNSPTLFYVHVSSFVDLIWVALRDPKVSNCILRVAIGVNTTVDCD